MVEAHLPSGAPALPRHGCATPPAPTLPPVVAAEPQRSWGLGAFAAVWVGGFVGGAIGYSIAAGATGTESGEDLPLTWLLGVALVAQNVAVLVGAFLVSRWRGTGSPRRDFGLDVRRRDWWWVGVGVAAQGVLVAVIAGVTWLFDVDDDDPQELVQRLQDERSPGIVLLAVLAIVVLAPLAEELLYRGLLLRSLTRWMGDGPAIVVSSLVFASVHLTGIDWGVSAVLVVAALFALALLLGTLAVRDGSLSRPILVHAGFNAVTTAIALLFGA
jgi:uncharacterized protein